MTIESIDITGKHRLYFDEEKHVYILDGHKVPGATGVKTAYPKSDSLIRYLISQGIEEFTSGKKLQAQADVGTLTHDYAYAKRLDKPFESRAIITSDNKEKVEKRFKLVDQWLEKVKADKVINAEQIVASARYQFGGKYDVLVERDGKKILQDYKSAKGFFEDQFIQLGGYSVALHEWCGIDIDVFEVIRFSDDADEPKSFLIDDGAHILQFEKQFIRLRETWGFQGIWKTMFERLYKAEHPYIKK